MSDPAPAREASGTLTYHEPQELGFLERLLVNRSVTASNALLEALLGLCLG